MAQASSLQFIVIILEAMKSALRFLGPAVTCLLLGCSSTERGPGPLSPEESMKTFRLSDSNLRVELFAAEPHVVDPVEIVFDEDGRAYAAEMRDYPDDPPAGQKPRSRIRLLEDTDSDGRIDSASIFAEDLLQVTSLLPWKGGLIVTSAPDILYLKDTDGDKKADLRKVLFTGFALVNSESRITNLRFGVDNWIYAANNGQQGNIRFAERPDLPPVSVLGADFRFRLDRGEFQAESGPAQFGLALDDWGQRFITQNTVHVRHVVVPRRYLLRNPFLSFGDVATDISDHGRPSARMFQLTPPQYWRRVRTAMRQRRYQENNTGRTEVAAGFFTGASGGTIYLGDSLPEEYYGILFTGDVAGNLVHRDLLRQAGVTFTASRAGNEQDKEFVASTDPWFRPCNFATGPDGHLYLVDMYREFIETPESVPEELKKNMNFYSGDTLGRIYRIVPNTAAAAKPVVPGLSRATTRELVALLSHRNAWWRLTAQRLLVERQDQSVIQELQKLAREAPAPQARLHALYALEGLSSLDRALVERALDDSHPGVRQHTLRLAEAHPELEAKLAGMIADESPQVRLQLALTLGQFAGDSAFKALAALAAREAHNPWFQMAILSSEPGSSIEMFEALLRGGAFKEPKPGQEKFVEQLAAIVGARNRPGEIARWVQLARQRAGLYGEGLQAASLSGLAQGLNLAGIRGLRSAPAEADLVRLLVGPSERVQAAARAVARHFEMRALGIASRRLALDAAAPETKRKQAIESLAGGQFGDVREVLEKILSSAASQELHGAAIATLGSFDDPGAGELLLSNWKTIAPRVRNQAVDVLLNHSRRVPVLLDALEEGRVETGALDLPRREKLLQNPDPQVASRAKNLFGQASNDRAGVVARYRSVLAQAGDAPRGRGVFEKNCASCHLPQKGQRRVGPDLSGISSQTREQLLEAVLDPSRAVQPRFTNYVITTRDGRIHDGLIISESPGTITLRSAGNLQDETVLRSRIATIRASSVSLMPDGLERNMSRQDLADLIAFLQGR